MKPGTRVRISKTSRLRETSKEHVAEFGNSVGVVLGPTDYGSQQGPEVDVRWPSPLSPHGFRYAYTVDALEEVTEDD